MPIADKAKAEKLLSMGLIRPDQFGAMSFPDAGPELPPPPEPGVPTQQFAAPIGPEVAPDFIPYSAPTAMSYAGRMYGAPGPGASLADLDPFNGERAQQMRRETAQREQEAFLPPVNTAPAPINQDPYLAADEEEERYRRMLEAQNNYPGSQGYGQMASGILDQGKALQEASRAQALEYQRAMNDLDNMNKDGKIQDIAQNTRSDQALNDLENMRQDLADTKIDSKRMFHNMGTGDKILASIALILGGFGGAASGGRNMALETIERAVERDVNDQKAAYNVKKEGIQHKDSLYGRMLEKFKNEDAAREAAKVNMFKMAELKLSEIGARYTDESTQGKVKEQLGKLSLLQDQAKAAFMSAMQGGDDPYRNMDEKQAKRYVPGYGFAPDEKRAGLANEATSLADTTIGNINTILTKAKTAGRFDFGANQEINVLVKMLRSENKEAIVGSGAITDTERDIIADIIRDPSEVFANRAKATKALEVIRDAATRTRDIKLKAYGLRGRTERYKTWQEN